MTVIKELLDQYDDRTFIQKDNSLDLTTNVAVVTKYFVNKGIKANNTFQKISGVTFYPQDYFCPIDYNTKKKNITNNTYTIHWFSGSWVPMKAKIKVKVYNLIMKILGEKNGRKLVSFLKGKNDGK